MLIELRTLKELTLYIQEVKRAGQSIGFVPTMGFLHKGHMSLVDLSKEKTDVTISSIYVNPFNLTNPVILIHTLEMRQKILLSFISTDVMRYLSQLKRRWSQLFQNQLI